MESHPTLRVLAICGSLRKKSFNLSVLRACAELAPPELKVEIARLNAIPMFNQDDWEESGMPAPAEELRKAIVASDGVVISTPEYNHGVSGCLTNAIDWMSRSDPVPFEGKPVAILSATSGALGGARVQYELRNHLLPLEAWTLAQPEVFIGRAHTKVDGEGNFNDEVTRKAIAAQMSVFRDWILRFKK
jgi:chromate reductase